MKPFNVGRMYYNAFTDEVYVFYYYYAICVAINLRTFIAAPCISQNQ